MFERKGRGSARRIPSGRRGGRGESFSSRGRMGRRPFKMVRFKVNEKIEYKNLALLQKFLTERGKILSHRVTGISTRQQRQLVRAVKYARFLGLLPVGVMR